MASSADTGSATTADAAPQIPNGSVPSGADGTTRPAEAVPASGVGADRDEHVEDKKKWKKRGPRRNKKRGTGFEEFFCDPPMTVEEYNLEQTALYPAHRPFVERIEECIQRFRARRHMNNKQLAFFSTYLLLGGVDTSQRQFQSVSKLPKDDLKSMTKGELREISANDVIQRGAWGTYDARYYNPDYPEHWDVDFSGVVAGSEHLASLAVDFDDYTMGVSVVSNFLKYVDRHDVCPEYSDDVRNAIALCEKAMDEMSRINEARVSLPGDFNTSAASLFCKGRREFWEFDNHLGNAFDDKKARLIFGVHSAVLLDKERSAGLGKLLRAREPHAIETAEETIEIMEIILPSSTQSVYYKQINQHLNKGFGIHACGSMVVMPVILRDDVDRVIPQKVIDGPAKTEVIFLEENILKLLDVGMVLDAVTCTLVSDGLKFIKGFSRLRPTFYTFLPQELMLQYKEPVKSDRPAKSADDEDGVHPQEVLSQIPIGEMSIKDSSGDVSEVDGGKVVETVEEE